MVAVAAAVGVVAAVLTVLDSAVLCCAAVVHGFGECAGRLVEALTSARAGGVAGVLVVVWVVCGRSVHGCFLNVRGAWTS
jgi:hypothetical protein